MYFLQVAAASALWLVCTLLPLLVRKQCSVGGNCCSLYLIIKTADFSVSTRDSVKGHSFWTLQFSGIRFFFCIVLMLNLIQYVREDVTEYAYFDNRFMQMQFFLAWNEIFIKHTIDEIWEEKKKGYSSVCLIRRFFETLLPEYQNTRSAQVLGLFWCSLSLICWGELAFHGLTNLRLSLKSPFSGWTVLERTTQELKQGSGVWFMLLHEPLNTVSTLKATPSLTKKENHLIKKIKKNIYIIIIYNIKI